MDITVTEAPELNRYEARVGGRLAGVAGYVRRDPQLIVFTHTRVTDEFEGRGIGGTLVRMALDDVRARGLTALPRCPFVKAWIDRHPEYADLIAHEAHGGPAERE